MQVLLVRHSHAELREDWNDVGKSDTLRPLTKKGIHRFAESVGGLSRFIPKIDFIYSSQFTRTIQTAEVLHGYYNGSQYEPVSFLNPNDSFNKDQIKNLISKHNDQTREMTICLVGHQPHLSDIANFLLESSETEFRFKKGGIALLHLSETKKQLQWLLTQRQLIYLSS